MTSISWLAGLGDAVWPSVGCAQFEFILPLPTDAGVAGLGAAVLVSAGTLWAVSARTSKAGHLAPLGRTLGENVGAS